MPNDTIEKSYSPYLALIGVQVSFGSLAVIVKVVLAVIPAVALVGLRVGITAVILFVFQRFSGNLRLENRRDYLRLAVLSVFGVTVNKLILSADFAGESRTSLIALQILYDIDDRC